VEACVMSHWRRDVIFAHGVVTVCGDTHEELDKMYQIHDPKIPTIMLSTFFNFSFLSNCGVAHFSCVEEWRSVSTCTANYFPDPQH
jgi:hypothetical protein